ncbi:PhoU-like phosphate uptake regulator [Anaerohalosphaera lusitana]|uniref:Phosphate-specific transport system accessory protein PhoU n=1 Tax=Anaerohalosphaera lusitana TaxID=1936003 RepID=A0A1U9NP85_9BACT|nr:phosphate signaling complex protein PhoU [Anaerohalosphaera lusitana]AQT69528.1 PhoU-like phosphate uptake regulator [Anaerohalosphaera lusitana]
MPVHMKHEIDKLKQNLVNLCSVVEEELWQAVKSVKNADADLAAKVIGNDQKIDDREVEIEEECLKILALYQPVAIDLRFIITAMKINNDLERIGDLTVNIAERSQFLANQPQVPIPFDFESMTEKTQAMLRKSVDALVKMDCQIAHEVCMSDDKVDAINRQMYDQVKKEIVKHPDWVEQLIHLLSISRHLERIADHTTNIAEDVIYMVEGKIVRHTTEKFGS